LVLNQRTHVAFVRRSQAFELYIDGALSCTAPFTGTWEDAAGIVSPDNLVLGAHYTSGASATAWLFQGKIEEARMYDQALSANTIALLTKTHTVSGAGIKSQTVTDVDVNLPIEVTGRTCAAIGCSVACVVDAVVVDAYDDMEVYINNGSGIFLYDETYGSGKSWFGVDLVDVDLDNDLDIIVAAFYSGAGCEVWLNDGVGNFSFSQGSIASSISMRKLGIGDLNGNGYPDIFAPAYSGSSSQVWYNDGNGTFINSNQALAGSSCTQAALADLDGDNDLVVNNLTVDTRQVHILR
jgi:hypothetical protein